eukprot:343370-Chlamydomonas_euryale.AAC.1
MARLQPGALPAMLCTCGVALAFVSEALLLSRLHFLLCYCRHVTDGCRNSLVWRCGGSFHPAHPH